MTKRTVQTGLSTLCCLWVVFSAGCDSNTPQVSVLPKATPAINPATFSAPVQGIAISASGPQQVALSEIKSASFSVHILNRGKEKLALAIYPTLADLVVSDAKGKVVADSSRYFRSIKLRQTEDEGLEILTPGGSTSNPTNLTGALRSWSPGQYTLRVTLSSPYNTMWSGSIRAMLKQQRIKVWGPAKVTSPPFHFTVN